jgi:hypothetical protein
MTTEPELQEKATDGISALRKHNHHPNKVDDWMLKCKKQKLSSHGAERTLWSERMYRLPLRSKKYVSKPTEISELS